MKTVIIYRVKHIRLQRGWSLRKLANKSGVSASHLSKVENNEAHLTIPMLWDLADALGCEPKELYEKL